MTTPTTTMLSDRSFALTQTFRSPAAKVFAAYTDPKQVPQWWGFPRGSLRVDHMDVRPGGTFRFLQSMPDGKTIASRGSYLEVKPVTRLVYTFQVEGWAGEPVTTAIDLEESGGKTTLTLTMQFATKEAYDAAAKFGAVAGAKGSLAALAEYLAEA